MKLPGIAKGAAQRLVRQDVNAPLAEANARKAAFDAVGGAISGAFNRYQEREDKRQVQEATLLVQKDQIEFEQTYGSKVEFNAMDYDDPIFLEALQKAGVTDLSQKIPAYRIMPEMRAKALNESFTRHSEIISSKDVRENWVFKEETRGLDEYLGDAARASQDQIRYSALQTGREVEDRMREKDYAGARLAILTADMQEPARDAALDSITNEEQENFFNETLELRDVPTMEEALMQLYENDEKTTSHIDTDKQEDYARALRGAIAQEERKAADAAETDTRLIKDEGRKLESLAWNGSLTDPGRYSDVMKQIAEADDPVLFRDMVLAKKFAESTHNLVTAPPSAQQAAINGMKKDMHKVDSLTAYVYSKQIKAVNDNMAERSADTMDWGRNNEVINMEPIDYSSDDALAATLGSRVAPAVGMQQKYGTFSGFLTKDEMTEFGQRLENMGVAEQVQIFGIVNEALGDNAEPFYEQLKKYNIAGTAPIAGQVAARGDSYAAQQILDGSRLRTSDSAVRTKMKDDEDTIAAELIDKFATAFGGDVNTRLMMGEAVRDLYAVTGDLDSAITAVTGGLVEYRGYTIQNPDPGKLTEEQYNDWIPDLHWDYWKLPENKAHGYTPVQVRDFMIKGEFVQIGVGRGASRIEHKGKRVTMEDGVTDYLFVYDPDAPTFSKAGFKTQKTQQTTEQRMKSQAAQFSVDPYADQTDEIKGINKEVVDEMMRITGGE